MHSNQRTSAQQEGIESIDQSAALIAGAGSGKTEVLTQRIASILRRNDMNFSEILAITFTEKAAWEMRERLYPILPLPAQKQISFAAIGTFHGIFSQILLEFAPLVGLSSQTAVLSAYSNQLLIHKIVRKNLLQTLEEKDLSAIRLTEQLDFRGAEEILEECLRFRWHAEKHFCCHREEPISDGRHGDPGIASSALPPRNDILYDLNAVYEKALQKYNSVKERSRQIDFQDLEIKVLELLQSHKDVRTNLIHRWKHILIDEMQDTNDLQNKIIDLLHDPKRNRLFIVGDPKQSVYRFRGANVRGFLQKVEGIRKGGGKIIALTDNFRSRPGILHFVNQTFEELFTGPIPFQSLLPQRKPSENPEVICIPIPGEKKNLSKDLRKMEGKAIAQKIIRSVATQKRSFGDFAILFQTLSHSTPYEEAFKQLQIPYRIFGGKGFLFCQEVSDLLFCLKLVVNFEDRMAQVGLMRSPLVGFTDKQILLKETEHPLLDFLKNEATLLAPHEILEQVIQTTHYDWFLQQLDPSGGKRSNVEQFLAMARQIDLEEYQTTLEFVEFIDSLKRNGAPIGNSATVDLSSSAVSIMTVHAAKGLEFPVVILPDLFGKGPTHNSPYYFLREHGFGFKLRPEKNLFEDREETEAFSKLKKIETEEDEEEKKRLLYVAVTRAQEELILCIPPPEKRGGLWQKWIATGLSKMDPPATIEEYQSDKSYLGKPAPTSQLPDILSPLQEKETGVWKSITVTDLKKASEKKENLRGQEKGLRIGNLVHRVLKNYRPERPLQPLLSQEATTLHWQLTQKEQTDILNLLETFLAHPMAPKGWGTYQEVPFRLKIPETKIILSGVIDFIEETADGFIIYDFKTDAAVKKENYSLQMDLYALALSKATGKPVLETRLLFLRPLECLHTKITQERLEKTIYKLQHSI